MNAFKVPVVAIWMIVTSGFCLFVSTFVLCILVYNSTKEIVENRKIGCISRALDNQQYAPQCEQYIPKGME